MNNYNVQNISILNPIDIFSPVSQAPNLSAIGDHPLNLFWYMICTIAENSNYIQTLNIFSTGFAELGRKIEED